MSAFRWLGIVIVTAASMCAGAETVSAQSSDPPRLRATPLTESIRIDGLLNEPAWASADRGDTFLQTDPVEGAQPSARTVVRGPPIPKRSSSASSATIRSPRASSASASGATPPLDVGGPRPHRPRPVSRRPIRLRVRGQPERRALRRPDQSRAARATTRTGTASGRRRPRARRRAGAPRSGFPSRPSASSRVCTSGTSTCSAAFSAGSKPIAGRSPARQYQVTQTSRAGLLTELAGLRPRARV